MAKKKKEEVIEPKAKIAEAPVVVNKTTVSDIKKVHSRPETNVDGEKLKYPEDEVKGS